MEVIESQTWGSFKEKILRRNVFEHEMSPFLSIVLILIDSVHVGVQQREGLPQGVLQVRRLPPRPRLQDRLRRARPQRLLQR